MTTLAVETSSGFLYSLLLFVFALVMVTGPLLFRRLPITDPISRATLLRNFSLHKWEWLVHSSDSSITGRVTEQFAMIKSLPPVIGLSTGKPHRTGYHAHAFDHTLAPVTSFFPSISIPLSCLRSWCRLEPFDAPFLSPTPILYKPRACVCKPYTEPMNSSALQSWTITIKTTSSRKFWSPTKTVSWNFCLSFRLIYNFLVILIVGHPGNW